MGCKFSIRVIHPTMYDNPNEVCKNIVPNSPTFSIKHDTNDTVSNIAPFNSLYMEPSSEILITPESTPDCQRKRI